MNKRKINKQAYLPIIVFIFLLLVCIYAIDVFTSKYIIFNGSLEEYQELIDINTENVGSLKNINYSELISFLENDTTDELIYSDSFNCIDFSLTLLHKASLQNISSGIAILDYHTWSGHCISCFNTLDEGLIFIEPQSGTDYDITNDIKILGEYSSKTIYAIHTFWN